MIEVHPLWHLKQRIDIVSIPKSFDGFSNIVENKNGVYNIIDTNLDYIILRYSSTFDCVFMLDYNKLFDRYQRTDFCTFNIDTSTDTFYRRNNLYFEYGSDRVRILGCTRIVDENEGVLRILNFKEKPKETDVILFKMKSWKTQKGIYGEIYL